MKSQLRSTSDSDETVAVSEMIIAYARFLRASGASHHTVNCRCRVLRKLHNDLPFGLAYASTDELDDWLGRERNPEWSQWTKHTYAGHISGFYSWAEGKYLHGNPAATMAKAGSPDGVPRPVTHDEFRTAVTLSRDPWRTAILIAAYAGLRVEEICGLHRHHVTQERIYLARAKGGAPAYVDTHPVLWEWLKDRPPGPLLVRGKGIPVTARWIGTHGRPHFDGIGLPAVTMHRFRHYFATNLLDETGDLELVRDALRHKSITSTQGYARVADRKRRLAIRSLPVRHDDQPPLDR